MDIPSDSSEADNTRFTPGSLAPARSQGPRRDTFGAALVTEFQEEGASPVEEEDWGQESGHVRPQHLADRGWPGIQGPPAAVTAGGKDMRRRWGG